MLFLLLACGSPTPPTEAAPVRAASPSAPLAAPAASPVAAPSASPVAAPARIIAVGDLHGDPDAARSIFRGAGLIGEDGHWTGGSTWLIQTGDVTDRGPDSRGVLSLLRRLQGEALAAGGRVVPLLGNHETMNILGDWRYVSPEDLSTYGGEAPRKAAFTATGEDGQWLRTLDAVTQVGDTVFMHGGMDPHWATVGIPSVNLQVRAALDAPDGKSAPVLGPDGPLWNRAYVLSDPSVACPQLAQALTTLKARRMVVGHTVREDGKIEKRCDGALWVIDTGNSIAYGSHLSALQITGDLVEPIYPSPG